MLRDSNQGTEHVIQFDYFTPYTHHDKYLDTLYFWFEDFIICGCSEILIFVAGECVHERAQGPIHQDFRVVTEPHGVAVEASVSLG
jgi:hypothetical protein